MENDKLVFNQRQDEQYHESYWVWPMKEGHKRGPTIPVLVGHLKQLQQGRDSILVGWVWYVDFKTHMSRLLWKTHHCVTQQF
jgi:hypothetical protein